MNETKTTVLYTMEALINGHFSQRTAPNSGQYYLHWPFS